MIIWLAYGKSGLEIDLPDNWDIDIIEPDYSDPLQDPQTEIRNSIRNPFDMIPLTDWAKEGERVGIVFSDITRPTPNRAILPILIDELEAARPREVMLFNGLGSHRPNTPNELCDLLGENIINSYTIVQNDAYDKRANKLVGYTSRGVEVWLNRDLMSCNRKILTGFIEPHFFAGFSGGGKAVMPGMAGLSTILRNHDSEMIAHPKATWGITHGNPIWEEIYETSKLIGQTFLLNVTLNQRKEITGIFAGNLGAAHEKGCNFVRSQSMVAVPEAYDIVITTNSGYPLDLNLYQSVKGMSAAAQIVRPGGAIIIASECWDGIPDHGLYGKLLRKASHPQELLDQILSFATPQQDQWQAQIQAQIQLKAEVFLYSHQLSREQIRTTLLSPSDSIEETTDMLIKRYGPRAKIGILPHGPQTIPYLA